MKSTVPSEVNHQQGAGVFGEPNHVGYPCCLPTCACGGLGECLALACTGAPKQRSCPKFQGAEQVGSRKLVFPFNPLGWFLQIESLAHPDFGYLCHKGRATSQETPSNMRVENWQQPWAPIFIQFPAENPSIDQAAALKAHEEEILDLARRLLGTAWVPKKSPLWGGLFFRMEEPSRAMGSNDEMWQ